MGLSQGWRRILLAGATLAVGLSFSAGCSLVAEDAAEREASTGTGAGGSEKTGAESGNAAGGNPGQNLGEIKGLYVPGFKAEEELARMAGIGRETEINALVIDVKDGGYLTYPSEIPLANEIDATTEQIPDLEDYVQRVHDEDLYAIARLAVFQDDALPAARPELAAQDSSTGGPWYNYSGSAWTNPYQKEVRDYNIAVAKEAAEAGFDEIQFDYVRFPSDGEMANLEYGEETFPSQEATIAAFLEDAQRELEPTGAMVSADVFGLVGVNDDVGIGQVVSEMAPHLDVISPMVYPSHYPVGSYGYENPDREPYDIVKYAMDDFISKGREANPDLIVRPWLQDFEYLSDYSSEDVRAQMEATYDSGLGGWILWNASGDYTLSAIEGGEKIAGAQNAAGTENTGAEADDAQYSQ
ncbi:putative glycoside hydrolase [Rubrobacter indicoceani]|uniref:putative glycoside hydrolase n=1 Tax=Rubrobacter indicoceani TaxID=2051957 RepID=UPI000E5BF7F5|nr:putative glycoside hydrolase [Rubrobacter indicoceani]